MMIFFFCWTFQFMHFSLLYASPSFPRDRFWHVGGGADVCDPVPTSLLLAHLTVFNLHFSCKSHREVGSCSFRTRCCSSLWWVWACKSSGWGGLCWWFCWSGAGLGSWWHQQAADLLKFLKGEGLFLSVIKTPYLQPALHRSCLSLSVDAVCL